MKPIIIIIGWVAATYLFFYEILPFGHPLVTLMGVGMLGALIVESLDTALSEFKSRKGRKSR